MWEILAHLCIKLLLSLIDDAFIKHFGIDISV